MASPVSSEATIATVSSLHLEAPSNYDGILLSVDRTRAPFTGYDQWQHLKEEVVQRGLLIPRNRIPAGNVDSLVISSFQKLSPYFVETVVLKEPGDFTLWYDLNGNPIISVRRDDCSANDNIGKSGGAGDTKAVVDPVIHLRLTSNHDGFFVASMVGITAPSLEELVKMFYSSPMNILSAMVNLPLRMERIIGPATAPELAKLFKSEAAIKLGPLVADVRTGTIHHGCVDNVPSMIVTPKQTRQKAVYTNIELALRELAIAEVIRKTLPQPDIHFVLMSAIVVDKDLQTIYPRTVAPSVELIAHLDTIAKLECVLQLALSLSELHRIGIVHGNIRTKAMYIEADSAIPNRWTCKLGGFKEAFIGEEKAINPYVHWHWRILAPEVHITLTYTKESDVYSFGVLLWEVFTGIKMHNGKTSQKYILDSLLGERVTFENILASTIPAKIMQLINQCCGRSHNRPTMNGVWLTLSGIYRSHRDRAAKEVIH